MSYLSILKPILHLSVGAIEQAQGEHLDPWLRWFGYFHYIFLHFPIVLIIMASLAECLFSWTKDLKYSFLVNFLLISAAILTIPTVLTGLALEDSGILNKDEHPLLEWHETFGIITLCLTIITVFIKNYLSSWRNLYLFALSLLVISVLVTSHLGGLTAFEGFDLTPPAFKF